MKNEFYFLIKHFDDTMLDHIRRKFDEESGKAFINRFSALNKRILKLKESGVPQDSVACQKAAEEFWNMVMEFTDGNMSMLPKLMEFGQTGGGQQDEWQKDQAAVNEYIGPALELYFSRTGMNPFGGTGGGMAVNHAIIVSGLKKSYGSHAVLKGLIFRSARERFCASWHERGG